MEQLTMKEYISPENQQKIRSRLLTWFKYNPQEYEDIAKAMGMNHFTLRGFLHGRQVVFKTLAMIEVWLEKKEGK